MLNKCTDSYSRTYGNNVHNNTRKKLRNMGVIASFASLWLCAHTAAAFHAGQMHSIRLTDVRRRCGLKKKDNNFDIVVIGGGSRYEGDFDFPPEDESGAGEVLMHEFQEEVKIREMRTSLERLYSVDEKEARKKNREFSGSSRAAPPTSAGLFSGSGTSVYSVPIARIPPPTPVSSREAAVGFNILDVPTPDTTALVQAALAFVLLSFAFGAGYSNGNAAEQYKQELHNGFSSINPAKIVSAASVLSDSLVGEMAHSSHGGASAFLC